MAEPVDPLKPGAGGWVPSKKTPLWAALFIGTAFSAGPAVLVAMPDKWGALIAAVVMGAAGSLATYFGMRSAGPRQS